MSGYGREATRRQGRDARDRRVSIVRPATKGVRIATQLAEWRYDRDAKAASALTPGDLQTWLRLDDRLHRRRLDPEARHDQAT